MRIQISPWWRLYVAGAVATVWFALACSVWAMVAWRTGDLIAWFALGSQAIAAVVWCLFVVAFRRTVRGRRLAPTGQHDPARGSPLPGEWMDMGQSSRSRRRSKAVGAHSPSGRSKPRPTAGAGSPPRAPG
jgi:hypothetical protein